MPYVNSPTKKSMCVAVKVEDEVDLCPAYKNVNAKSIICFTAVVDDFFLRRHLEFEIADAFFRFSPSNIHIPFSQTHHQSDCMCLSFSLSLSQYTFCYVGGDP